MTMRGIHTAMTTVLVLLAACGPSPEEVRELREGQRRILAKLADLDSKIERGAARPAGPQGRQPPEPGKVFDLPVGTSPVRGPASARVALVLFSDFQCPFCAKVPSVVDEVLKAYPNDVKVVFKEFPLTTIHQFALNAARAAVAAQRQGKFWEMHDALFANQRQLDMESLKRYAQQVGLDVPAWEAALASPEVQQQIDADVKLAQTAQVSGTPSLFVNGKRAMNRSVEGLKAMIDEALHPTTPVAS